jgi:hypothetical protein
MLAARNSGCLPVEQRCPHFNEDTVQRRRHWHSLRVFDFAWIRTHAAQTPCGRF